VSPHCTFGLRHYATKKRSEPQASALGLSAIVTGFALSASGFDPNQAQTETAKLAIRTLMSGFPLVCYGTGALLFLRFGLTRRAHAEIRATLDTRR